MRSFLCPDNSRRHIWVLTGRSVGRLSQSLSQCNKQRALCAGHPSSSSTWVCLWNMTATSPINNGVMMFTKHMPFGPNQIDKGCNLKHFNENWNTKDLIPLFLGDNCLRHVDRLTSDIDLKNKSILSWRCPTHKDPQECNKHCPPRPQENGRTLVHGDREWGHFPLGTLSNSYWSSCGASTIAVIVHVVLVLAVSLVLFGCLL